MLLIVAFHSTLPKGPSWDFQCKDTSPAFLMSKRLILEPTERYLSGDISHPWGSFEEKVGFFESSVHQCTPMRVEDGISKNWFSIFKFKRLSRRISFCKG